MVVTGLAARLEVLRADHLTRERDGSGISTSSPLMTAKLAFVITPGGRPGRLAKRDSLLRAFGGIPAPDSAAASDTGAAPASADTVDGNRAAANRVSQAGSPSCEENPRTPPGSTRPGMTLCVSCLN